MFLRWYLRDKKLRNEELEVETTRWDKTDTAQMIDICTLGNVEGSFRMTALYFYKKQLLSTILSLAWARNTFGQTLELI